MNISIKKMTLVAMFTSLTALGAFISLPIGPVAITLQSLFVILSGIILGPKLGPLSQVLYVFLGLIGIPIFSNFNGGLQSILMPSFGFIIGFIFASYLIGRIVHSGHKMLDQKIFLGSLLATLAIYAFGLPYMYYILNTLMGNNFSFQAIFKMGCLVFLPGDLLKLFTASFLGTKLLRALNISI